MEKFTHKTLLTTPLSQTYSYYLSPNFHSVPANTPTLMFTHGFPDDAYMWTHLLPTLLTNPHTQNYRILLAEILGFGGTSKPTAVEPYNYRHQAASLAQILDTEGVRGNVIPVGHDWGSATAQRFYLFHRERCIGLCIMALAYMVPSLEEFDLEKVNAATEREFGYPQWEYWYFFTAEDAPRLLRENIGRFWEVNNGVFKSEKEGEEGRNVWMREMFCKKGAMRDYLTSKGEYEGFTVDLHEYAKDEALRKRFEERLGTAGLEGGVNYYHGLRGNTMLEEERELAEDKEKRSIVHPCLYIGFRDDWVCRTDQMKGPKEQGLVDDLREVEVEGAHWSMYDRKVGETVAGHLVKWLEDKFPSGK